MEVHYGQNRIILFPQDIEEEMAFDGYESGQKICSTDAEDKPSQLFEVIDRVVCLRVKRLQNQNNITVIEQSQGLAKKRRFLWWKF